MGDAKAERFSWTHGAAVQGAYGYHNGGMLEGLSTCVAVVCVIVSVQCGSGVTAVSVCVHYSSPGYMACTVGKVGVFVAQSVTRTNAPTSRRYMFTPSCRAPVTVNDRINACRHCRS